MKHQTFSDIEYSGRKRKTKREEFLEIMEEIIPWNEWLSLIKPLYPSGRRGRPPRGLETMLRMFLVQAWFKEVNSCKSSGALHEPPNCT